MTEKKEIVKLESATIRLITATQIATSVSDIVKELVENALDAGSTVIRVKLVINKIFNQFNFLINFFVTGKFWDRQD
jgi:DNA mismatch repair ATPase MutL